MTTFVSDAFTDTSGTALASHTGATGATWAIANGTGAAVISDANRVRGASINETIWYASGAATGDDMDVTADFVQKSTASVGCGITGRQATAAKTCYVAYRSAFPGWSLYKWVAGSVTSLGSYSASMTNDVPVAVKLEIRDATKKVYLDGVERISSADNAITGNTHAGVIFSASNANSTGVHIDNFLADEPVTAVDHPLAGTVLGTGSQTGTLTEADRVSGTSLGTGGQTGAVRAAKALVGSSLGTGSQSGAVLEADSIAGSSLGTGTASGSVGTAKPLTGSVLGTGGATGAARASKPLSVTSTGTGSQTGALAEADTVAGTSGGTGTASGSVVVAKALGGSALGMGGQTGALSEADTIAGTSQGSGEQAGALVRLVTVAGGSVGQGSVNAEAWVARRLTGSALGQGDATGDIAIIVFFVPGITLTPPARLLAVTATGRVRSVAPSGRVTEVVARSRRYE